MPKRNPRSAKSTATNGKAPSPAQFDLASLMRIPRHDYLIKFVARRLNSFPVLFDLPPIIERLQKTDLWSGFYPFFPDFLALIERNPPWSDWVQQVLLHIEFVTRFRPKEIGARLRRYAAAITLGTDEFVDVVQLVLVDGPPPKPIESLDTAYRSGWTTITIQCSAWCTTSGN